LRDEGATFTCSSFFGPEGDKILSGANDGTLRLFDVNTGVVAAYVDEYRHSGSVRQIQTASAFGSTEKPFALSSSASETFLWDLSTTPDFSSEGPVATFEGACSASFDSQCARVFHAGGNTPGTACLYDITAGKHVRNFFTWNLMDQALGVVTNPAGASRRFTTRTSTSQRFADTSFGPNGSSLVLWGHTLWDVRLPHPIKTFDSFSDGGGVSFHPRGDEVVLNGEVWDLRSDRLLRCVSSLDGCSLSWTKTWDVAVASYRPPRDENIVQSSRRTKHPLRNAFRTVDCASDDFSDIATIDIDRNILHVSWDKGTDSKCCVSECDPNDVSFDSVVRVYEAGRVRPTEEDSDAEDEGDEGDEGLDEGVDLHLNDDEFRAMDEMNVLDEDDEQRAARTAAAIAGNGAALAGLRALLGGMVADRIRDAVIGQGADDDDVEFSLEPENDADDGDDNDSVNDEDSEVSESESESVLLSLSSSGDETGDSVEELEGESSDDDESEGGF
jgi:HIV-1 Vpr-binding protein